MDTHNDSDIDRKMDEVSDKIGRINDFISYLNESDVSIDDDKWKVSNELINSIICYGIHLNIIDGEIDSDGMIRSKINATNISVEEFETILNSIRTLFDGFLTMKSDCEHLNIKLIEADKEKKDLEKTLSDTKKELSRCRSELTRTKKKLTKQEASD